MTTIIVIVAYIANVFFNRWLTYLAVKNQGKYDTITYNEWVGLAVKIGN